MIALTWRKPFGGLRRAEIGRRALSRSGEGRPWAQRLGGRWPKNTQIQTPVSPTEVPVLTMPLPERRAAGWARRFITMVFNEG